RPAPDEVLVAEAAKALATANFPAIYAGGGVQRGSATAELLELAEILGAPVIMTSNGKGSIDDRHRLAFNGHGVIQLQDKVDVAFAVGTRFLDAGSEPNGP